MKRHWARSCEKLCTNCVFFSLSCQTWNVKTRHLKFIASFFLFRLLSLARVNYISLSSLTWKRTRERKEGTVCLHKTERKHSFGCSYSERDLTFEIHRNGEGETQQQAKIQTFKNTLFRRELNQIKIHRKMILKRRKTFPHYCWLMASLVDWHNSKHIKQLNWLLKTTSN